MLICTDNLQQQPTLFPLYNVVCFLQWCSSKTYHHLPIIKDLDVSPEDGEAIISENTGNWLVCNL